MAQRVLVVVDMQNDFVTGTLENDDALQIIDRVAARIRRAKENDERVIFTMDTHTDDYLKTEEGKNLPVMHCIEGTPGWELIEELKPDAADCELIKKETFGSTRLGELLQKSGATDIELIGICTDICVISNAMLVKAFVPDAHIRVDASCCAGVTPESHKTVLAAMRACHVEIVNG